MALEHLPDGVLLCDAGARVLWANPAATELLGATGDVLCGVDLPELLAVTAPAVPTATGAGPVQRSVVDLCPRSGGRLTAEVTWRAYRVADGTSASVVVVRDVTGEVSARRRLEDDAAASLYDPLTGLYNRRGFAAAAGAVLHLADRTQRPVLAVFVDLDGLKHTNDTGGHRCGDDRLVATATTIASACRSSDVAARLGGDEFVVLAYDAGGGDAVTLADRISARPGDTGPLSVGWSTYLPGSDEDLEDLVERADLDMYRRRTGGAAPPTGVARVTGPTPQGPSPRAPGGAGTPGR